MLKFKNSIVFCLFIGLSVSSLMSFSQAPFIKGNKKVDMAQLKKTHPRVLVGDFEPIKKRLLTNATMQNWLVLLKNEKTPDAIALNYRLTGNQAYIQAAIDSAMNIDIVEKIKKGPHHYGKTIQILGCAYDWLHDDLSAEQRNQILKLLTLGLEAYLKDPDKTNFHNMNHCLNAGAIVAAIAVADEAPDLAKKVLEVAVNTINISWYQPEGVTPEGPHYMNWSSLIMMSGLATLDVAFNNGFGLTDDKGLMGYGDFMLYSNVPSKGVAIKYSDCYTNLNHYNLGQLLWLADKFNRPDFSQFVIENDAQTATGDSPDYTGKIHQLLWYQPERFQVNLTQYQKFPLDKQFDNAALAIMRAGWNDENSIFTAIKGTDNYHQANFYHRHTNTGTFFLDALGEEWAVDLGLEDYAKTDYNSQPRLYYKLRAEGHNCNIINPASGIDQEGWDKCSIVAQGNNLRESFAVLDMTPDYIKLTKSAKRGIKLFDNRTRVLLQDEFTSIDGKPIDSYWFMQTEAGIEIAKDGRSAILYRGNEKLLVSMATAPKYARFTIMGTEPLIYTKPVKFKEDWTFGAKKLVIHTNQETDLKLAIVFTPIHDGETIDTKNLAYVPLIKWGSEVNEKVSLASIRISDKIIPNFDARNFTYTVDVADNQIPDLNAISSDVNAKISIKKANSFPGKTIITVKENNGSLFTYNVYFRKKQAKIIGTATNEYTSWDESFANHRVIAPKVKTGAFLEYELNGTNTISAATIGFLNQNMKSNTFEVWSSIDKLNWKLENSAASQIKKGLKMPMPQLFTMNPFEAKYIRIKNVSKDANFTIDALKFHTTNESAENYINHVFKEVLSDIKLNLPKDLIALGGSLKLEVSGKTNYDKPVDLGGAQLQFATLNPEIATINDQGIISGLKAGETYVTLIFQLGDYVFHKKLKITVG